MNSYLILYCLRKRQLERNCDVNRGISEIKKKRKRITSAIRPPSGKEESNEGIRKEKLSSGESCKSSLLRKLNISVLERRRV